MRDSELYNEKKLLAEIENGDETAFRTILSAYWDTMYANILYHCKRPDLSSELTQDLFMAVWQNRSRLHEIERFDAYLYTIAKNLVLGALRKKVLPIVDSERFDPYFVDDGLTGIDVLELRELQSVLNTAIQQLPPQMKQAFTLHRLQGLSHEQVAQEMKISRFSSQTYVARAIVQLRAALAEHQGKTGLFLLLQHFL